MMISFWAPPHLTRDRLFAEGHRDDCLAAYRAVKNGVERREGLCHTQDWYHDERRVPDVVIFMDIPKEPLQELLGPWYAAARRWVILQEPPIIIPRNFEMGRHADYERFFTWNDALLGDSRYRKLNYCHQFPDRKEGFDVGTRKLCVMIAGNRRSDHPLELYAAREQAVRWFETHHSEDFDLYGFGWDRRVFGGNRLMRAMNRVGWLGRLLALPYPSWRGTVAEKRAVLARYRFAICYENCRDLPGYITEKIFDCFFAGCVPVYWGANNITDYIPAGCFIDQRQFPDMETLYGFLRGMSEEAFQGYLSRIEWFLRGPSAYPFKAECFAETIISEFARE